MHACEYVRAWTCESLRGDACVCGSVYLCLYKVHAHCDCCKAMHACVGVCICACTRCMLTVIAARWCMRVWECVFGLVQSACSLWLLWSCACVCFLCALFEENFVRNLSQLERLGICIALPWLSVLKHGYLKVLPDCCHEHPNYVATCLPNNWPACLINILAHTCAYTLPSNSSRLIFFTLCILVPLSLRAMCPIIPKRLWLLMPNHVHACMHTYARTCPRVFSKVGAIILTRIFTHRCDHAHVICQQRCYHAHACSVCATRIHAHASMHTKCNHAHVCMHT
jgi:hypothetical protein